MSFKLGLALGLAAGVVVGLATAPRSGRELRRRLSAHLPGDSSTFAGNGQGSPGSETPTLYETATEDGDPPTLYKRDSEDDG